MAKDVSPGGSYLRRQAGQFFMNRTPAPAVQLPPVECLHDELCEQLHHAQLESEARLVRYDALYDGAPVGYVTLQQTGEIILGNAASAQLLECTCEQLPGLHLGNCVAPASIGTLATFMEQVFTGEASPVCEIMLAHNGRIARTVQVRATWSAGDRECHAVMVDITALQQAALLAQTQEIGRDI